MLSTTRVNFGTHSLSAEEIKVPGVMLGGSEGKLVLNNTTGDGIIQIGSTELFDGKRTHRLYLRTYNTDPSTGNYKDFAVWTLQPNGETFLNNQGSIRTTDTLHVGFIGIPKQTARVSVQDRLGDFVDFHYGPHVVGTIGIDAGTGVILKNSSHFVIPSVPTENKGALPGSLYYNQTTNKFMGKTDQGWVPLESGPNTHTQLPTPDTQNDAALVGSLYYNQTTNKFMGKTDRGWVPLATAMDLVRDLNLLKDQILSQMNQMMTDHLNSKHGM